VIVGTFVVGGALLAQSVLTELGLTETAARNFLFQEIKSPARERRSDIAIAGNRAFLKLPPSARGQAATALFAWTKAYVNSAPFKTAYASFRRDTTVPQEQQHPLTVDEEVKKQIDELLAGVEEMKQAAASMDPANRARILESVKPQEARYRSPEFVQQVRTVLEAERAARGGSGNAAARVANEPYPADPQKLFARRLRGFLEATSDANFAAKTISLTGGTDGIEFVDPADRKKSWVWQAAVIVGQEATTAARAAAEAWLKEIEP